MKSRGVTPAARRRGSTAPPQCLGIPLVPVTLFLALLLLQRETHAALPLVRRDIAPQRAGALLGWDQTWVTALAYGQGFPGFLAGEGAEVSVSLTVPLLNVPEVDAVKLEGGFELLLVDPNGWGIALGAASGLALAGDPTGKKLAWLGRVHVRPGWYGAAEGIALDLGVRAALSTYMWHSELVRDLFRDRYPQDSASPASGPVNGWYPFSAFASRLGLVGGYRLGAVTLLGIGGFEYSPQVEWIVMNPSVGGMPFYLKMGADYRW